MQVQFIGQKNQYQNEGPLESDVNFEVKKGDRFRNVSSELEKLGIINNSTIFNVWARYAKQDEKLKIWKLFNSK